MTIQFCTRCIMPNTRPRVVFNNEGVCNACLYADKKNLIAWEGRRSEFLRLIEPYRSKDGRWDCVVPWSGGKDSSTIAYKLKFEYGMNPLLCTFSPLIPNEVGHQNRELLIQLGFDFVYFRPNQKVSRRLARRFFEERGNQKVAWDAGINAIPVWTAIRYRIPLVFYAEHGESEYGGKVRNEQATKIRDFTEVIEHLVGDDPRNWIDDEIGEQDLNPYIYPPQDDIESIALKVVYFGYFFRWSMLDNFKFIRTKIPFQTCPFGRTEGTFTDFDSLDDKTDNLYYYMQYIKFGFGRATRDACRMIQNGQMTRQEAIDVARKYDHEFPRAFFKENLEYLNLTENQFFEIVDKHRDEQIWIKNDSKWELRFVLE